MKYQDFLTSKSEGNPTYPYNTLEFLFEEKVIDTYYLDASKLGEGQEDKLTMVVDDYLNDHPDVDKAIAYRVEDEKRRFPYREFGRD